MSEQYKPLPDWSEIDRKYNFRAVNFDGELFYYKQTPSLLNIIWAFGGEKHFAGDGHDATNWRKSLEARPEKIPNPQTPEQ